jgi:hypothetical protein
MRRMQPSGETTELPEPASILPSLPSPSDAWLARARWIFSLVVLTIICALTYLRLYFGVDLTDEAYYTAVPYRFVLGAHPLVDETILVQQTSALLLYPFVKLYSSLAGFDGLILYARHLHFLFSFGIGLAAWAALRRCLRDGALSALVAGMSVAVVPFGIHGLSYNTFASGFFAAGTLLAVACLTGAGPHWGAASGVALGLALFTYPTFAAPVVCCLIAHYLFERPRSIRALAPSALPVVVAFAVTVLFFVSHGIGYASDLVDRSRVYGGQGGGLNKATTIISDLFASFPHKVVALGLILLALALRRWTRWAVVPLLAVPLAALPADLHTSASSNQFVTNLGLLAPLVFVFIPHSELGRRFLGVVWLPAAVAGETTSFTSANGAINFAIGFFPAAIVTAALLALVADHILTHGGRRASSWESGVWAFAGLLAVAGILAICVGIQYSSVYRDASLSLLTTRVDDGPYAGIRTTVRKQQFLTSLERDLGAASGADCTILFYDTFPAGYLLDAGRSDTNSTWIGDVAGVKGADYQRLLIAYYLDGAGPPDVAVRLDRIPLTGVTDIEQAYPASDPLEHFFRSRGYVTVRSDRDYRIRRKPGSNCKRS